MVLTLFQVVVLYLSSVSAGKSVKKFKDESSILNKKLIGKSKSPPPAVIAIEIVDPNENKTSKNSKRTIDSSLGYGYHSPAKYQVYKYSQHDIPAYRGSHNLLSGGIKSHNFDLQKSVSYNLPSQSYKSNLKQYYQPGTTLYSTVNSQGQVGGLSSHVPQHGSEPQVPVIILRVYPSQLNDPSAVLHPNLPQSHPLSSVVNSIDVQALLSKYVQNVLVDQHQPQQYYQQQYQQPVQDYQYQYVQQPHYDDYSDNQADGLLTHENYPKETHTRVIFRTDKNKIGGSHRTETKTIQVAIPEQSYSSVQVETPHMQYSYTSPGDTPHMQYSYTSPGDTAHMQYSYISPGAATGQEYYYQQGPDVSQNYYYQMVPETGYQQVEQQVDYVQPVQNVESVTPHNYHAHQKRSKKARFSRNRQEEEKVSDVIKLNPIKA
jgi:hypothetical protein